MTLIILILPHWSRIDWIHRSREPLHPHLSLPPIACTSPSSLNFRAHPQTIDTHDCAIRSHHRLLTRATSPVAFPSRVEFPLSSQPVASPCIRPPALGRPPTDLNPSHSRDACTFHRIIFVLLLEWQFLQSFLRISCGPALTNGRERWDQEYFDLHLSLRHDRWRTKKLCNVFFCFFVFSRDLKCHVFFANQIHQRGLCCSAWRVTPWYRLLSLRANRSSLRTKLLYEYTVPNRTRRQGTVPQAWTHNVVGTALGRLDRRLGAPGKEAPDATWSRNRMNMSCVSIAVVSL